MQTYCSNAARRYFPTLLYIYSGEDLPEVEVEKISAKDAMILKNVVMGLDNADKLYSALLQKYNVKSFKELTQKQRTEILEGLAEMSNQKKKQGLEE